MRALATAVVTAVLLVLGVSLAVGQGSSPLCPPGYHSEFNVNQPGCTFCFAPTDCAPHCLGPPQSFCPPGDDACCTATPCSLNCPQHDSLQCNVSTCDCSPDTCCSTVCPAASPAPAASPLGYIILTMVLVAFGMATVYAKTRRR
jgi:hypothetical protein